MKRVALLALLVPLLVACGGDDPRTCLRGHVEKGVRPMPVTGVGFNGQVTTTIVVMPYSEFACDEYAPEAAK